MSSARDLLLCALALAPLAAQSPATGSAALLEYHARARLLAADDPVGHFALAEWCGSRQLTQAMRWELRVVLQLDPDHVGARATLGEVWHEGRWLPRHEAMRRQGMVEFDGRWLPAGEAVRLREQAAQRAAQAERRANALLVQLASRKPAERDAARRDLLALADEHRMPDLARLARRMHAVYDDFWTRAALPPQAGLLTVNTTRSELVEMKEFTTSLGTGQPVRLQLPTVRTAAVNTTVIVPLSGGR